MKNFALLICLFVFSCCNDTKLLLTNLPGTYTTKGKDYSYKIQINKDETFSYERKSLEVRSRCIGTWKYVGGDSIRITCDKSSNLVDMLTLGYIGEYSEKIILKKNKLKLKNVTLKRSQ